MLFEVSTKTFCGFGITKDILPKIMGKNAAIIMAGGIDISPIVGVTEGHWHCGTTEGEPTYSELQEIIELLQSDKLGGFDCIIGIGGGSAMDYAKALAVLYTNPGKAIDYRGFDKVVNPGLPTILIPTTAGTGSEITPNAVFTDTDEKRKLGINGRHIRATYAILDAEWTLTCPYSVALSSLLDAFVHAVESYMAPEATPLTRALSREAFRLLYQNALSIKKADGVPNTPEGERQRQNLLYGAYLAAMALSNSGSGVVGAMSYPLGVHFGIPHGYAGGIFLPDIVAHNIEKGYDFGDLRAPLAAPSQWHLAYCLGDLWTRLEVPNLKQWIKPDQAATAMDLMDEVESAWKNNPVPFLTYDAHKFIGKHI